MNIQKHIYVSIVEYILIKLKHLFKYFGQEIHCIVEKSKMYRKF